VALRDAYQGRITITTFTDKIPTSQQSLLGVQFFSPGKTRQRPEPPGYANVIRSNILVASRRFRSSRYMGSATTASREEPARSVSLRGKRRSGRLLPPTQLDALARQVKGRCFPPRSIARWAVMPVGGPISVQSPRGYTESGLTLSMSLVSRHANRQVGKTDARPLANASGVPPPWHFLGY